MSTLSTLEVNSLKGALEALLLVSSDPVSAPALAGALDIAPGECASLLAELKVEYEEANRGFQLREVAGGWRLFTHPAYHDVVEAYVLSWDTQKLSQAALETLAVIAYHQPVTREVVKGIRGVNSDHAVNRLVEYGLVYEAGRLDAPGRPALFATTEEFLRRFGVSSMVDLPTMNPEQEEEIIQEVEEELQMRLGAQEEEGSDQVSMSDAVEEVLKERNEEIEEYEEKEESEHAEDQN